MPPFPVRLGLAAALLTTLALGACKKEAAKSEGAAATPTSGTVSADGVRSVPIEAGKDGYVPDSIPGKPGEKLKLVFTRTVDGDCLAEVKMPDGKVVPLPKGTPVEVPITVPASGQLTFACGMGMFQGVVVANAKS